MAKGKVSWVNPPENKGKIVRNDISSSNEYEYNVSAGDTIDGYVPAVGDNVDFTPNGQRATLVKKSGTIISFTYSGGNQELTWQTQGATRGVIDKTGEIPADQLASGFLQTRETPPFILTTYDANDRVLDTKSSDNIA